MALGADDKFYLTEAELLGDFAADGHSSSSKTKGKKKKGQEQQQQETPEKQLQGGYWGSIDYDNVHSSVAMREEDGWQLASEYQGKGTLGLMPLVAQQHQDVKYPLANPMTDSVMKGENAVLKAVHSLSKNSSRSNSKSSGPPTTANLTAAAADAAVAAAAVALGAGNYIDAFILLHRFGSHAGKQLTFAIYNQVLLLLGSKGTRTKGHIDPAAALTIAWLLLKAGQQWTPDMLQWVLAVWLFIAPVPEAWTMLLDWMVQHGKLGKDGTRQLAKRLRPDAELQRMEAVQELLGGVKLTVPEIDAVADYLGPELAVKVEQRSGEAVVVKVGYMHWVCNVAPNFKVAYELLRPGDAMAVVQLHRTLRCAMTDNPQDYMKLEEAVLNHLMTCYKYCKAD